MSFNTDPLLTPLVYLISFFLSFSGSFCQESALASLQIWARSFCPADVAPDSTGANKAPCNESSAPLPLFWRV